MSGPCATFSPRDANAGDILWLRRRPIKETDLLMNAAPVKDIFNHPIMIWSVDLSEQSACVLIVSEQ